MLRLVAIETRQLLRERVALLLLLVLTAACIVAVVNGRATMQSQIDGRAASAAEDMKADEGFRKRLTSPLPPEEAILSPYRMRLGVSAPVPVLVDFSAGRATFENYSTQVTMRARPDTLFKRTNTENPELLARGSFDLGYVAIVLAPLLLIGLGYGLFASDRDSGTARLILAQAGSPVRMLTARSIPRLLMVIAPILVATLVLLATGPELAGRSAAALQWLGIAALLVAFWWAVILFVNSLKLTAETAALALVSAWAVFTLVLPSAISAIAQSAYPPPSRFEQIATARAAEVASTTAYENDHPDAVADDAAGRQASIRKTWEIAQKVDAAIAPINTRFDTQLSAQQNLVRTLGWVSPPLIAGEALTAHAGTNTATWLGFREATRSYLDAFRKAGGKHVEDGTIIDAKAYAAIPRFAWTPKPQSGFVAALVLALLTLGIGGFALRRFAKLRLD